MLGICPCGVALSTTPGRTLASWSSKSCSLTPAWRARSLIVCDPSAPPRVPGEIGLDPGIDGCALAGFGQLAEKAAQTAKQPAIAGRRIRLLGGGFVGVALAAQQLANEQSAKCDHNWFRYIPARNGVIKNSHCPILLKFLLRMPSQMPIDCARPIGLD
jgi:hypothetical protein